MRTSAIQLSAWFWHFAAATHCLLRALPEPLYAWLVPGVPALFVATGIRVTAKGLGIPRSPPERSFPEP